MPSYGILLPTRGSVLASDDAATLAAKTRADVVDLARRAETSGFDSVWVGDSVLARPRHEPLTTLAAVGAATDAVDLGTAVYLPTLRKPANVAHLTATVDMLSGGRLRMGVGVGTASQAVRDEYGNLDVPFEERGARLNELLAVVTRLWTGDRVDFDGEHYDLDGASLGLEPVRTPPIYVATGGYDPDARLPATIRRRLVEYGDGCIPTEMAPETYAESLSYVSDLLEESGRDPSRFDPAYYMDVVIGDSEAAAIEEARAFYDRYYAERDPLTDREIREKGAFGTPADVAAALDAYVEAGVETFVVRFATRNQRETLQRFARDVLDA